MKHVTDLSAEPIDPELRACLEEELANLPGARIVKRRGHLFFQSGRYEFRGPRLSEIKRRWIEMVEHADLAREDKWKIFCLLTHGTARLEHIPGVGLKATLPARARLYVVRAFRTVGLAI